MIKIGILTRESYDEEQVPSFLIREPNLRNSILEAGGTPFLLVPLQKIRYQDYTVNNTPTPTKEEIEHSLEMLKMFDGIVLPGGDEWTYLDEVAIEYAKNENVPLLGICLGMQAMGIDGNLENMKTLKTKNHHKKEQYVHSVVIKKDTLLERIIQKEKIQVNSRHFYTIEPTDEWTVSAVSDDGVVEAIERKNHPFCLGIQWHPEDMVEDKYAKKIFSEFINACQKRKKDYNKTITN